MTLPRRGIIRNGLGSVTAAQEAVGILETEGCSVIVGIGHTGWNDDLVSGTLISRSEEE